MLTQAINNRFPFQNSILDVQVLCRLTGCLADRYDGLLFRAWHGLSGGDAIAFAYSPQLPQDVILPLVPT